ncbi:hypothetical protein ACFQS7_09565 [Dankookia sp. GCM10030260]|uniref:hypothetical protein n=1 Tax=Dankookia sp. GCM10030260 TaxID=3273390 RepID=UPI003611F35C
MYGMETSRQRVIPIGLLVLIPVLANLFPLVTDWSADPRYYVSGLSVGPQDSLLPGLPGWLDPHAGLTMQSLGGLAARNWLSGVIPWWNPYSGLGLPLVAEMQPAAFFLPFVLLLSLEDGLILQKMALQVLAGLATYALLRRLGLTRAAALLGGICYQVNGTFAWFADAPITPIAFLPLFLLGLEHALHAARTGRAGGWAAIGAAIGYSLYAGFPETAYLNGLLALAWATVRWATEAAGVRLAFLRKVAAGGVSGLLVAAPLLLPFAQFMAVADESARLDFNRIGLLRPGLAAYLLPYIFGPVAHFQNIDPTGLLIYIGGMLGGYVGVPLAFLVLVGLLAPRRERALRLLLAGWIAVHLARTAMVPGITQLVGSIPLMDVTAVFRYSPPSWEMAAIILAAFALDAWQRQGRLGWQAIGLPLLAVLLALGLALAAASGIVAALWRVSLAYRPWPLLSLGWAALTLASLVWLLRLGPARGLRPLAALLVLDAMVMFGLPLLAGTRNHALDTGAVAFLQRNLGLQRFYTLAPLAPNYGAHYGVASINHSYQPIPRSWVAHVKDKLDPAIHPAIFAGNTPAFDADGQTRLEAFQRRQAAYAADGVRYVLAFSGQNPLAEQQPALRFGGARPADALPIPLGGVLDGTLPSTLPNAGDLVAVDVVVGTFHGAADGDLVLRLCAAADCVEGRRRLAELADNLPARIPLERPLSVAVDQALRIALFQDGATRPAAIWVWRPPVTGLPGAGQRGWLGDPAAGLLPTLSLAYATTAGPAPAPVYRGPVVDIFELPDAAPYFEVVGGPCRLRITSREMLTADCDAPARLIRREFAYDGWSASVNGQPRAVRPVDGLFQSIDLPAGGSEVRFAFAPPHIRWTLLPFILGLAGCAAGRTRDRALRPTGRVEPPAEGRRPAAPAPSF